MQCSFSAVDRPCTATPLRPPQRFFYTGVAMVGEPTKIRTIQLYDCFIPRSLLWSFLCIDMTAFYFICYSEPSPGGRTLAGGATRATHPDLALFRSALKLRVDRMRSFGFSRAVLSVIKAPSVICCRNNAQIVQSRHRARAALFPLLSSLFQSRFGPSFGCCC